MSRVGVAAEGQDRAARQFPAWNFSNLQEVSKSIYPEDFFPLSFLNQIEEKRGAPVVLNIRVKDTVAYFKFFIKKDREPFSKFRIEESKLQADTAAIEDLLLEDPTKESTVGLNFSQRSKGLPPSVFFFAKSRIFDFLRAGGFKRLLSAGARNYIVSLMYEKIVGMTAENSLTLQYREILNELWKNFVPKLPAEVRPKSIEEFALVLGQGLSPDEKSSGKEKEVEREDSGLVEQVAAAQLHAIKMAPRQSQTEAIEVQLRADKVWFVERAGKLVPFAIMANWDDATKAKLLFVFADQEGRLQILRWYKILDSGADRLIRDL